MTDEEEMNPDSVSVLLSFIFLFITDIMVYSGRYSIKNPSKYTGDVANIVYRSLWEKAVFMWCDGNPKVKSGVLKK